MANLIQGNRNDLFDAVVTLVCGYEDLSVTGVEKVVEKIEENLRSLTGYKNDIPGQKEFLAEPVSYQIEIINSTFLLTVGAICSEKRKAAISPTLRDKVVAILAPEKMQIIENRFPNVLKKDAAKAMRSWTVCYLEGILPDEQMNESSIV